MSGIYRVRKDARYFAASNEPFNDTRLSWEARGVMGYLLSKPDGWELRNHDLINQTEDTGPYRAGRDKVNRIVAELKAAGYVRREQKRDDDGRFTWVTEIYESPRLNPDNGPVPPYTDEPYTAGPRTGDPLTAKPYIYKVLESASTKLESTEVKGEEPAPGAYRPEPALAAYLQENKIPLPRDAAEEKQVTHPAAIAWMIATNRWPAYSNLDLLIDRLGPAPALGPLEQAWRLWSGSGHNLGNLVGVLDWYDQLCADANWTPGQRRAAGNTSGPAPASKLTNAEQALAEYARAKKEAGLS